MYKTILVNDLIQDGKRFLQALQAVGFPISAALWRHLDEIDVWKLIIVSPVAETEGPFGAYRRIVEVLNGLGNSTQLSVGDIVVVRPASAEFKELQRAVEGPPRGAIYGPGAPLQDTTVGDSYVYQWQAA